MQVYIASDHGGFELKDKIKRYLLTMDITPIDCGADSVNPEDDYPVYGLKLCNQLTDDNIEGAKGILICRSGVGMSIVANKVKGIYAALCSNQEQAIKAREHNNANVLCLDADYEDDQLHFDVLKAFLNTEFAGWDSRHGRRLQQILDFESKHLSRTEI